MVTVINDNYYVLNTMQQRFYRASRNLERSIITASQVLCFSCSSIVVNLRRIIPTMRSISFAITGRVLLCSRNRLTTCVVNSEHACINNTACYVNTSDEHHTTTLNSCILLFYVLLLLCFDAVCWVAGRASSL